MMKFAPLLCIFLSGCATMAGDHIHVDDHLWHQDIPEFLMIEDHDFEVQLQDGATFYRHSRSCVYDD